MSPLLLEVRSHFDNQIGYFSGRSLNVDVSVGLNGECDFLLSGNASTVLIRSPLLTVVEAKNNSIQAGLGQCVAQMVGAQRFNAREKLNLPVWGAVTTGTLWRFLRLYESDLNIDRTEYVVPLQLPVVLGGLITPFAAYFASQQEPK